MTRGERRHSRGRDIAWVVLAVVMVLYGLAAAVGVVACAVGGNWFGVVRSGLGLPFTYWVGVGAWRRTSWGDRPVAFSAWPPGSC